MPRRICIILLILLGLGSSMLIAQGRQQFASLGDFRLENGQVIRDCKIGYRTFGQLNASRSNAILWPTWFTGTTKNLMGFVGTGKLLDPAKYYVILVDALGDGISSSPSNSAIQPHMHFPQFTIRDMVNAEHKLATQTLHLSHLHTVMGISMGGMQTFQWIVSYPNFMDKAIPIVGSPRLTSYDLLLWTAELHALEEDPAWNHGDYQMPPQAGMDTVADIHSLALTTPTYRVTHTSRAEFPHFLQETEASTLRSFDANNWIRQLQAMLADDVSAPYGGSMEKAAAQVHAKVLVIPSQQDHMVNPIPALNFAHLIHARVFELTSNCGHLATGCELSQMTPVIQAFLQ